MRRFPASRVSTLILAGSTCVLAQETAPPLQPPQLPASSAPASPAIPRPPVSPPMAIAPPEAPFQARPHLFTPRLPSPRPLLPRFEPAGIPLATADGTRLEPYRSAPRLEPPITIEEAPILAAPLPGMADDAPPLEGPQPIPLETAPDETVPPLDPLPDAEKKPRTPRAETLPVEPVPRRRGLLGLFVPRPRPESLPSRAEKAPDTRSDPSAEAALKRRIETQIREVTGRRLRSLEVRVREGSVTIHARADRFWNRRSLRRDIEALPSLAGHNTAVFVD